MKCDKCEQKATYRQWWGYLWAWLCEKHLYKDAIRTVKNKY